MPFTLLGFSQRDNVRHFCFEHTAADRSRTEYTVDADLVALRTYGISMQELPLMCRRLLEALPDGDRTHELTLTEQDMRLHADAAKAVLAQAAQRRKAPFNGRRPGQPSPFGQMNRTAPAATVGHPAQGMPNAAKG